MDLKSISIDIVLATYNGERYISEQIDSIMAMSGFDDVINKIIICDDRSKDGTLHIVKSKIPSEKLIILENYNNENLGVIKNFERGILCSTAEFVMLSDQDDVWNEEKLDKYVSELKKMDADNPLMIFSDLEVVDSKLKTLSKSFFDYQSTSISWGETLNNILIQNIAPGCTMLFNRQLINKAFPLPEYCVMHDWWLLLVAKQFGEVKCINEPLIKYRQHENNQVGAKRNNVIAIISDIKENIRKANKNLKRTIMQMNAFRDFYSDTISTEVLRKIEAWNYCYFGNGNIITKLCVLKKNSLKKSTMIKTIGTYFVLLWSHK